MAGPIPKTELVVVAGHNLETPGLQYHQLIHQNCLVKSFSILSHTFNRKKHCLHVELNVFIDFSSVFWDKML